MPPDMAVTEKKIDMRHTKLTAEDAALLSGELKKPSWQSRNEGIHERVSFEDSIWGFDLAGGSYYKTPLRVVHVKPGSRADKAGIRMGDRLKRINDIDTSTLTIQEAHEIIIESGVHLKIAVTAPEDEEDAYFCYEDPTLEDGYDSEEERRLEAERARKRIVHAKVRSDWSLQWPWVSKRRVIWHESNCFLVPSKYEGKHRDKFPPQDAIRKEADIVMGAMKEKKNLAVPIPNGTTDVVTNGTSLPNGTNNLLANGLEIPNGIENSDLVNGMNANERMNGKMETTNGPQVPNGIENESDLNGVDVNEEINGDHEEVPQSEEEFEKISENSEMDASVSEEASQNEVPQTEEDTESKSAVDEVIDEVLNDSGEVSNVEDDSILDSILSDSEHTVENTESVGER